jgi:hypothetical protein
MKQNSIAEYETGIRRVVEGVNSSMIYLYAWYIVRTFINATVYPHTAQQ